MGDGAARRSRRHGGGRRPRVSDAAPTRRAADGRCGAIEEVAKLLVPACVLLWMRYRIPADGLLLGVAAGAGFAAFETMGYAFVALLQSHGNLPAVTTLLLMRGLLSPAGHMAWTGIASAALWSAACSGWTRTEALRFLGVLLAVIALHTAWDSIGTLP